MIAPVDGLLVVDKPQGMTSHDVVALARRVYGTRQVGHGGTLDPEATGVLLLMLGQATKLNPYLTAQHKHYRATVSFGRSTDTDDAVGRTLHVAPLRASWLDASCLEEAIARERARSQQLPPVVSALKFGGVAAHRLHRQGHSVPRQPRVVKVFELSVLRWDDHELDLDLVVSKGYYVRSLARDIGDALGTPAHLSQLRRLGVGDFTLQDSVPWPLEPQAKSIGLPELVRRVLPTVVLDAQASLAVAQGRRISADQVGPILEPRGTAWDTEQGQTAVGALDKEGRLIALLSLDRDEFRVLRGFVPSHDRDRTNKSG